MTEPIRILQMIGSLNVGGSQSMIINLYKNIDREKIQFDFILDHPQETYYKETVVALGAKIYEMPTFTGKNIFQIKKAWNKFFKEHPEYKILHSHVRSYASIYIPIAKKYGLKTIIHSHSTSNGKGAIALVKKLMQLPLRHQADYFMACSKEAGQWLFGKKIVNGSKYHMLQNAIDLEQYHFNAVTREKYRDELGLNGKMTFIHVGRFHPAKNHFFLLDAFANYHQNNPNSSLILVGDGELRNDIERKICELGIERTVILTGNRKDVANLLMAADCFLFPSNWEGLPVTVVEAQASGLHCLVSNHVTNDVMISPLAHYLSIDDGTKCWVDEMSKINFCRLDVSKEIQNAGFDIKISTAFLSDFYFKVLKE